MNNQRVIFDNGQFDRLFPFYVLINQNLTVDACGKSLSKITPGCEGRLFFECFFIKDIKNAVKKFDDLIPICNRSIAVEVMNQQKTTLRGSFEYIENTSQILFIGAPWFSSIEKVTDNNLTTDDFSFHDPLIHLLHVLKAQEIGNRELQRLLDTIHKQRCDLDKAYEEVQNTALFSMQSPDPLLRIGTDGKILMKNPCAEKLGQFRFENKVYTSHAFWELMAGHIDRSKEKWTFEASSGEEVYSFVCRYLPEKKYFNIYGRDITLQKKNEQDLLRLSMVAKANTNGVLFTNKTGGITYANEGFCDLTGHSMEEIMGKSPIDLCKGPLTDIATLHQIKEAFFRGIGFDLKIIYYKKDGTWFWGRSVSQPIVGEDGKATGFFCIIEDVTKQKESHEKLKVLSQIAEDNINAVTIADKDGYTTWVNRSFSQMTGYSLEESVGKRPADFLYGPDTDSRAIEYLRKQVESGESFHTEILNYTKEGTPFWLRMQGQPIKSDNGEVVGFFSLQENITVEKGYDDRLRSVLEKIGDNVWEHDFVANVTTFTKSSSDFIDPDADFAADCRGPWLKSIYKEDLPLLLENTENYKNKRCESHTLEYRMVQKDGSIKWILDRGVVIQKDADGYPLRITGTCTNITERKHTENKLDEQRRFYENILNNIPSDIAVFNPDHVYLFLNPKAIKDDVFRQWMIGKKDEDFCSYRNLPMSIAHERHAIFNKVKETKMTREWEDRVVSKDGLEHFILRRMCPVLDENNEVTLVIGYGLDISERKKAEENLRSNEEKYRGIIATMNLGLMEVDKQGMITFANQSLLDMTGLSAAGAQGYDAINFLSKESIVDVIQRLKKRKKGMVGEAFEVRTNIGDKFGWWLVSSAPKYGPNGTHIGSIIICLDITNQKRLQQELIASREQAEHLAKAKEMFLTNMSHEIRTPMNAIIGMGNQLAKSSLSEQQHFYLDIINTAAENLLVIINDILDLSKIEAGRLVVEKIAFEPRKVLDGAMHTLKYKAEEKGLKLINSYIDDRLPQVMIGDPHRINQVLLNLMSNAIKFTEKGTVDVTFDVVHQTGKPPMLQATVKDSGIGIEEEFVGRLFEKFSQEYESASRVFGGTGLGMSICKQLVELMGGTISVTSLKGKGTTVTITVEMIEGTASDLEVGSTEQITVDFLQQKTILVVDDNEMNRLVAATILENYGATIVEAKDGEEALAVLENQHADMVLMDIQMPLMNGYEATKILRKRGNNIPIIALTANAIKGENEKCIEAGMNDYIAKPFKEDVFLEKIEYWLFQATNSQALSLNDKGTYNPVLS